jgi:hypothetical protein
MLRVRSLVYALSGSLALITSFAACGGGLSASFPDASTVVSGEAIWCKGLAKAHGEGDKWSHMSACQAAFPSSSSAYLKGMAKCFPDRVTQAGEKAADNQQLITDCNDTVTAGMNADDANFQELIEARCKRAERCEKTPFGECKTAFSHLETAQKATLTSVYNYAALHEIASCLGSASCSDNEDEARAACYKPQSDKLLWFP